MTQFAECQEFGDAVALRFPNMTGDPTPNFATMIYIGLFDRFVDTEGLVAWSAVMDATPDRHKKQAAKDMALACLLSEEGQIKAPDNETLLVRLYRAFLGRFPAVHEIEYGAGELDQGNETLESLIAEFGDSAEFAQMPIDYFGSGAYPDYYFGAGL